MGSEPPWRTITTCEERAIVMTARIAISEFQHVPR